MGKRQFRKSGHWGNTTFCRTGAASAASSIKVPLNDIRYSGGWSTNSNVLEAKYIVFVKAPSKAACVFFGHLKRDKPLDA